MLYKCECNIHIIHHFWEESVWYLANHCISWHKNFTLHFLLVLIYWFQVGGLGKNTCMCTCKIKKVNVPASPHLIVSSCLCICSYIKTNPVPKLNEYDQNINKWVKINKPGWTIHYLKYLLRAISSSGVTPRSCNTLYNISFSEKLHLVNEASVSSSRMPAFQNRSKWSGESILGESDAKNCLIAADTVKTFSFVAVSENGWYDSCERCREGPVEGCDAGWSWRTSQHWLTRSRRLQLTRWWDLLFCNSLQWSFGTRLRM